MGEVIAIVIALIGAAIGFMAGRWDGKRQTTAKRNLKASEEVRGHEQEASQLNDTSLADRISRRD